MKFGRVISAAAQGIVSRSHHAHWSEVNPIKRQTLTPDERAKRRQREDEIERASRKRQQQIKRRFPASRILYT